MISEASMERITRIKKHLRDLKRAEVAEAERRHEEARREETRLEDAARQAARALGEIRDSRPEDLELMAQLVVESSARASQASDAAAERARELETERELRVEAERELRGIELAGKRVQKREEDKVTRAEDRLAEIWASRRRP
jgi:hypothetical protein